MVSGALFKPLFQIQFRKIQLQSIHHFCDIPDRCAAAASAHDPAASSKRSLPSITTSRRAGTRTSPISMLKRRGLSQRFPPLSTTEKSSAVELNRTDRFSPGAMSCKRSKPKSCLRGASAASLFVPWKLLCATAKARTTQSPATLPVLVTSTAWSIDPLLWTSPALTTSGSPEAPRTSDHL
eukprot:COSAG02_NODE_1126_length_14431_cov_37.854452_4_plen_181_part_00